MSTVLPAGHVEEVKPVVFDGSEVAHIDVRPGTDAAENSWIAVFDAAEDPAQAAAVIRLSADDGNVLEGDAVGTLLRSDDGAAAVLFSAGATGSTIAGNLRYRLPQGETLNVVADLQPDVTYAVTTTVAFADVVVDIAPGPGPQASPAGVLSFTTP